MTKSNGIKSLKQAAKLLNKHSPDGESLAYINKDEAKLLRSHGGSGIQTLQGVPSYLSIFGYQVPFTKTKEQGGWTGTDVLTKVFGYGKQDTGEIDKETGKKIYTPGRSIVNDAMSIWVGLRAKKEQEGLNAAEMEQFNKLNQQLAAAETEFDVSSDFGAQLKPDYKTDITKSAAYTPIDFSGSATPDLTTTAVAQGGRIGFDDGGPTPSMDEIARAFKLEFGYDMSLASDKVRANFIQDYTGKAQGGRIGYDEGTHPLDNIALQMFGDTFENLNPLQQITVSQSQSKAQGGRIGAFNGGIQGLMPQQGFMPQPGLDPRIGFNSGGETAYEKWLIDKYDLLVSDLSWDDHSKYSKLFRDQKAQGGRIGYNLGGIQGLMPQQGFMPQPGLDPRMGYAHGIGPQRKGSEIIDMNMEWGGPEQIEWSSAKERGMDKYPLLASKIMRIENEDLKYIEDQEEIDAGAALFDKAWDLVNRGLARDIGHALQMLRGEMDQPMGAAQGGRIGAQGGGVMPLLDMGGMEKDYRQDGGFVPIGRKEKADDVPARLSKNEFVFTADAVKAAGGGDIDQGAQRMYNVMKNLEAGGEISEQSQGKA